MCPPIISSNVPLQALATEEVPGRSQEDTHVTKKTWLFRVTSTSQTVTHQSHRREWGSIQWWRPRSPLQSHSCKGMPSQFWEHGPQTRRSTGQPWQRQGQQLERRWRCLAPSCSWPPRQPRRKRLPPEYCQLRERWGQRFPGSGIVWSPPDCQDPPLSCVPGSGQMTKDPPTCWGQLQGKKNIRKYYFNERSTFSQAIKNFILIRRHTQAPNSIRKAHLYLSSYTMWVLWKSVKRIRTGSFVVTFDLKLVRRQTMWRNRLALNLANLLSHSKTLTFTQIMFLKYF